MKVRDGKGGGGKGGEESGQGRGGEGKGREIWHPWLFLKVGTYSAQ